MRKAKLRMMLIGAMAAFALLLAGVERAQAQSGTMDDPFALPTGNFIPQSEAVQLLDAQVINLKSLIVTLVPGTVAYKTAERAIFYYSTIQGEVDSGKDVPSSIVTGLTYVSTSSSGSNALGTEGGPDFYELWNLRNAAIDLLNQ